LEIDDGDFYFVNADTSSPLHPPAGNDTSGCGTITSPCATIGYAAGVAGASGHAPAGSIVILRGANTEYTLPTTLSAGNSFNVSPSSGPSAYIGMPGETPTVDLTNVNSAANTVPVAATTAAIVLGGSDIFFGNLAFNGYGGYGGTASFSGSIS